MINYKMPKMPKMPINFECEKCTFVCFKQSNYNNHLLTAKHQMIMNDKKIPKTKYICECGKEYLYHSGLSRHKKICIFVPIDTNINNLDQVVMCQELTCQTITCQTITEPMIMDIIKQNQELQKQILELSSKPQIINNSSSKFNLNFFLNEQCKDALNITDFINSLQMQLKDLENFEALGYVQNISNIFIRGLKSLDICKRPIHCSDLKREVLYIKDQNAWEKDTEQKNITTAIKKIAHKNIKQIPIWENANPTYIDIDNKKNDQHMKIVDQVMGGATVEEDASNYNKIIKNVMKEIIIDKT